MGRSEVKRVLLCGTDAGGLKNLIPIVETLLRKRIEFHLLTESKFHYLVDWLPKEMVSFTGNPFGVQSEHLLHRVKPTLIITGTTRFQSPDRIITSLCKQLKITTVAVQDEWYNYRMRFENDNGELQYLPDYIAIMDKVAYQEAVDEGIPQDILRITGSPALTKLYKMVLGFQQKPPPVPLFLKEYSKSKIITFISEEFIADYSCSGSGDDGKLGPFQGYNEETVLMDIIDILQRLQGEYVLIDKLHPGSAKIENAESTRNKRVIRVRRTDLLSLLWYSDIVIGMKSVALLEAAIMGKPTVSYQPGLLFPNQCTAVKLDLIPMVTDKEKLEQWIFRKPEERCRAERKSLSFIDESSVEKILKLGEV
jgi:hypothetical protein